MQRLECFLKSLTNIYFLKLSNSARVCNRLGERLCFETSQGIRPPAPKAGAATCVRHAGCVGQMQSTYCWC